MPQFTRPAAGHLTLQLLILGCVFPVVALAIDAVWAFAAGTLSQWLSRSPRRMAAVGGVGGLVMIGLGVSVAATGRRN
jgi:threonine/homoserine/homoserine lactone efflux protein